MNRVRLIDDWEQFYREKEVQTMPWFNPDLDPDLDRALNNLNLRTGTRISHKICDRQPLNPYRIRVLACKRPVCTSNSV